jgi:hypothetical protein
MGKVNMKRIAALSMITMMVGVLTVSLAGAQDTPLGDAARQVRKQKTQQAPAAKTFDNDTLPRDNKLSVVGQAPEADANAPASDSTAASPDQPAAGAAENHSSTPASGDQKSPADDEQAKKQAMYKEWQTKIQAQQDKIDLASRELDVLNREYRLRAAAFYADAGNRLRNSGEWDKEDAQFKDQIAAKQKTLDDAKKGLEDMQEDARKAGVPSSMRE